MRRDVAREHLGLRTHPRLRVRVGDVEVYDVDAAVLGASMPYVLLGNSFLTRFQMKRENDVLRLEKRN